VPNQTEQLDLVFRALSDPTRRAVLHRLGNGDAAVTELAEPFEMALPSFLQHLRVLEDSGLIRSTKQGRVRTVRLRRAPLEAAASWLARERAQWERRLDRLDDYLLSMADSETKKSHKEPKR
jgi:DNA-binding transcriptional ArsR family regulator